MKVWTVRKPSPFQLGGNLNKWEPMSTDVEPLETHTVDGITLHVVKNPNKEMYHVAEGETGAFVGAESVASVALANVVADIFTADKAVMEQQIKDAKEMVKRATHVTPEEFWRYLR